jgi:hypothetical protein
MTKDSVCDSEETQLQKIVNFGLPNHFKKIGIAIALVSFLGIIILKITGVELSETIKFISKRLLLVGLLVIALAREKVEDEMIHSLRVKAFTGAFIGGVVYTLVFPAIVYGAKLIFDKENILLTDVGDFQILWFMLFMYLVFFYLIKRKL